MLSVEQKKGLRMQAFFFMFVAAVSRMMDNTGWKYNSYDFRAK